MAKVINTASDAITFINTLYESDSTVPTSSDEDFTVWLSLMNIAINLWEAEEGVLWKELFSKLSDASDGDKTSSANDVSYDCPTNFKFPASGYVWLGSGTAKIAYKVITPQRAQVLENDTSHWCYFMLGNSSTLEFNPNLSSTFPDGYTISYNYYKDATALVDGDSTFEMSDPMFAVYYALSELKKEEGDVSAAGISTQKLEGMRTSNFMPAWLQDSTEPSPSDSGFGI